MRAGLVLINYKKLLVGFANPADHSEKAKESEDRDIWCDCENKWLEFNKNSMER